MASVQRNHMDTMEPETLLQGTKGKMKHLFWGDFHRASFEYLGCHGDGTGRV